jgi:hypothetical protein
MVGCETDAQPIAVDVQGPVGPPRLVGATQATAPSGQQRLGTGPLFEFDFLNVAQGLPLVRLTPDL